MKKFIVLSLFGLLILGFSAAAYAQVDFKAYGMLNFGFTWDRNFANFGGPIASYWTAPFQPPDATVAATSSGAFDKSASYMQSYANIFLQWNAGKEVSGVFNIETCNYHSGTNTIATNNAVYNQIQGAQFDTGLWDTRLGETRLRNAYLDFAVPYFGIPVPMSIRGGIIPMAVRPSFMFAMTEGAGVQFDIKADPSAFTFLYGKMAENKTAVSDDSNWYSLEGRTKMGDIGFGGYLIYNKMKTYPIGYNEDSYGVTQNYNLTMWWIGAYSDGKIGPVNYNLDLAIDTGKVIGRPAGGIIADDVKYNGWATQAKLTYSWQQFAFGALGGYWSGADLKKTDRNGLPGSTVANGTDTSSKVSGWVYPAGDGQFVGWAESLFLGGSWSTLICIPQGFEPSGVWNTYVSRGSTGGTWVAKLFATYPLTDAYKVTLWALYIGDTTKNGNTMGNAVKADGTLRDDKSIGWELSLINDIQIYKNLNWKVGVGMLFAGDALDQRVGTTNTNKSPKNPYMLSTVVSYNF